MSLNKWIGIGRLTRQPELRYTSSGTPVATFTIAIDRQYKNQQGEKDTDFIRVVCWRKLAELVANNLDKGRLVCVEGSLQISNYEDKEGVKRQKSEIVANTVQFLDYPKDVSRNSNSNFDLPDDSDMLGDDVPF